MPSLDKLNATDRTQFMELLHESLSICTHYDFFVWLQGRLQQHIPHDILIASWGDFSLGLVYFDVISALHGVRTEKINNEKLTLFLKRLFAYWGNHGCSPLPLSMVNGMVTKEEIGCEVIDRHFNNMKSVLVHGIKDFRGRHDCLYVLLSTAKTPPQRVCTLFEALLPYIDTSLRRVAHLPEQLPNNTLIQNAELELDCLSPLSTRETEIMKLVQIGKTNIEVGTILDISSFTVKNHMQRIFKKLDVTNRAQAVSKFQ